jgi:hypothetical protein
MATEPTNADFQVFQAVTVASMGHSATLATWVIGGVLRITNQIVPMAGGWLTTMAI